MYFIDSSSAYAKINYTPVDSNCAITNNVTFTAYEQTIPIALPTQDADYLEATVALKYMNSTNWVATTEPFTIQLANNLVTLTNANDQQPKICSVNANFARALSATERAAAPIGTILNGSATINAAAAPIVLFSAIIATIMAMLL